MTDCRAWRGQNVSNRARMRTLVQKLSAVQEAVVVTTIFVGWFIYSAIRVALVGFSGSSDANVGYTDAAAISLVVWECTMFAVGALVLRWRGWKAADFLFAIRWRHRAEFRLAPRC